MSKFPITDYSEYKGLERLDKGSYTDHGDGTPSKQVTISNVNALNGGLVIGIDYDTIDITYPSATEEIYTYILASVAVQTIEVDYSDATKDRPTQVRVS